MSDLTGKKDLWRITVKAEQVLKVAFDRHVTKEEAIELFREAQYEDIIDEDTYRYDEIINAT